VVPARGRRGSQLSLDARVIFGAQALRAFVYGLGSVVIGVSLERAGLLGTEVGVVLAALLAGNAGVSLALARFGDKIGRKRAYRTLLVGMAAAGTVFAVTSSPVALVAAALTGTVSTEVVESGPFSSLEQAMLAQTRQARSPVRLFAAYNTVATLAGSLGALAALLPGSQSLLLAYPVAALAAWLLTFRLSSVVEREEVPPEGRRGGLRSRPLIARLAALFALDSFGGGFVTQTLIAYLLARRFGASDDVLGAVFFATGLLQAVSFYAAAWLADRIGLLRTMVLTHLPSNVLLAAIAFAPSLEVAVALLLGRFALSQMDVPTRQAYLAAVVDPGERVAAAAYTSTARYAVRPAAPLAAGPVLEVGLGAPFLIGGAIKVVYDLALYALLREVRSVPART
jgi:MFS family permease